MIKACGVWMCELTWPSMGLWSDTSLPPLCHAPVSWVSKGVGWCLRKPSSRSRSTRTRVDMRVWNLVWNVVRNVLYNHSIPRAFFFPATNTHTSQNHTSLIRFLVVRP